MKSKVLYVSVTTNIYSYSDTLPHSRNKRRAALNEGIKPERAKTLNPHKSIEMRGKDNSLTPST